MSIARETLVGTGWWDGLRRDAAALGQTARLCSPAMLLVPLATLGSVWLLQWTAWFSIVQKDFQEVFAPSLLAISSIVALGIYRTCRHPYLKWQAWLTLALFCRELHFYGTNNGIYVALIVLFWYAGRHAREMSPYLTVRSLVSLVCGALVVYALAKTFDRGYWNDVAGKHLADTFEESLESTGHLLIFAAVCASGWLTRRLAGRTAQARRALRLPHAIALGTALLTVGGTAAALMWADSTPFIPVPESGGRTLSAGALPSELSSLCRVEPGLGENLFLASSDESSDLSLWTFDASGRVARLTTLKLEVPLPDGSTCRLDDIEGLAWDGGTTYFAVASHRQIVAAADRRRLEKTGGTECALVSFRLRGTEQGIDLVEPKLVSSTLLPQIRELDLFETVNWHHDRSLEWRHLAKEWQIDIEGLTWVDGRLLLGFKNPVEEGRATILAYDPAHDRLTVAARPNLNGQGILDMTWDSSTGRLLILSNDPGARDYGDSCLWTGTRERPEEAWAFDDAPRLLERGQESDRKASGIVLTGRSMFLCFDSEDGAVLVEYPRP